MARQAIPCGIHIDWPCCGCNTEVLTDEDALERMREEDAQIDPLGTWDCDPEVLADDGDCGPDMTDVMFEDRVSGGYDD